MRTTINLPDEIRLKLLTEASYRNLKGYSEIIIEALKHYFQSKDSPRKAIIKKLKGSLSKKEASQQLQTIAEGRKNWKT